MLLINELCFSGPRELREGFRGELLAYANEIVKEEK
jgi:hypothetical protein